MTPAVKTSRVKALGRAVGLDLIGIAPARPLPRIEYYKSWLAAGYAGSMTWLARYVELREDPARLLPGAKSVICAAISYRRAPVEPEAVDRPLGQIAAYARGKDYHIVLRQLLVRLLRMLRVEFDEPFAARICVDTAPVLERELACLAGLGWIGKNTCLINRNLGSELVLGEVITTLDLEPDSPVPDLCGKCTRCLEACPTKALAAPYQLNASRCVSYLTIEHRGSVPEELHAAVGTWVFGCDICQQVCPYNRRAPLARQPDIAAEVLPAFIDLGTVLALEAANLRQLTRGTAAARATATMWRRNAAIALGNVPLGAADQARALLKVAAESPDLTVQSAAGASLRRLETSSV